MLPYHRPDPRDGLPEPPWPPPRLSFGQQLRRRSTRQAVRSAAGTAAAVALVVAAALYGGHPAGSPTPSARSGTAPAPASYQQRADLIAPATAAPGERLVVLGHRNPGLCGPAELRFDGRPVRHETLTYTGRARDTDPRQFMSVDVPRSATPGTHRIDLFGPVRSAGGVTCGDVPEHQAHIDTVTISVTAARPSSNGEQASR